jgi:hypothetical protein
LLAFLVLALVAFLATLATATFCAFFAPTAFADELECDFAGLAVSAANAAVLPPNARGAATRSAINFLFICHPFWICERMPTAEGYE